jgi:hypothetical protein
MTDPNNANPTPAGYASDPQLIMLWTAPPDLTGNLPASGSAATMPPPSNSFNVNLASMQAGVQAMLNAGSAVVSAYNPLEQEVQQDISGGTIFGQQATYNTIVSEGNGKLASPLYDVPDTQLRSGAEQAAALINPAMTRVLRLMADGMETAGAYIALLTNSGQMYTAADKNSVIPPVPTPGAGH